MTQVSMIAVRALAAAVEGAGVERQRFLTEAGLSAAQLDDLGARISLEQYGRVRRAALSTSGDPALGLHMGGEASMGRFDVLGSLAEHSSSLRQALELATRYARVFMEGPRLELLEQGELATVRCTQLSATTHEDRMTAEFVTSSLLYLMRRFVGNGAQPRRVLFTHQAPTHSAAYDDAFGGLAQFGQPFTGIEFERAWLDSAHAYRSPELHTLLQSRAELLLARVEQEAPAAERVRRWLAAQPLRTRPTMSEIGRALGMSARSLRRRLHDEQVPYDALVETARADRAKHMLREQRVSIQETAYALGFATPSAFSRTFRRWTGMTPSEYRDTQ